MVYPNLLTPASLCPRAQRPSQTLNTQHFRLFMDLFSFEGTTEFEAWLNSPPVLGAWAEFTAALPTPHPDPGLSPITSKVKAGVNCASLPEARFHLLYADKRDWSVEDHHIRFIVGVISDSLLDEAWMRLEWGRNPERIMKAVYEVLVYLKATSGLDHRERNGEESEEDYSH